MRRESMSPITVDEQAETWKSGEVQFQQRKSNERVYAGYERVLYSDTVMYLVKRPEIR